MDFVVGIVGYTVVDMSVGIVEEYIVGIVVVVVVEDRIAVDIAAVGESLAVGLRLRFEKGLIEKKVFEKFREKEFHSKNIFIKILKNSRKKTSLSFEKVIKK